MEHYPIILSSIRAASENKLRETVQAVTFVGDGPEDVQPEDITASDLTVMIREVFQNDRPEYVDYLSTVAIRERMSVYSTGEDASVDHGAVVVLTDIPVPTFSTDQTDDIDVTVTVKQVREAEAAVCPGCGADLRGTFTVSSGCADCGFHPDGDAAARYDS
ncbi:hypothetical protein PNP85_13080 [Halobacterium salinarum]|uniref:hypothetical protein n=1 Tax=Halobacterium salinarum TaxID=2242 RepID=UPI002552A534|nr:hypothetical protein [Halobacterium salinarum]MDL0140437.1 hypothetical protein [Halobacterium salinarum]